MSKTINILFLDDMQERTHLFAHYFMSRRNLFTEKGKDFDLRAVETAEDALSALKEKHWDVVCLDHDLGGKVFVESGKGTGFEVAEWIGGQSEYSGQTIIIHSWNIDGAKAMASKLLNYAQIPFGGEFLKMTFEFALRQG